MVSEQQRIFVTWFFMIILGILLFLAIMANEDDDDGNEEEEEVPVETDGMRPVANLTVSDVAPLKGKEITLNASDSWDPDGEVVAYRFDFGDGINSSWVETPEVEHSYTSNEDFNARVMVRDNDGVESNWSANQTIEVWEENIPFEPGYILPFIVVLVIVVTAFGYLVLWRAGGVCLESEGAQDPAGSEDKGKEEAKPATQEEKKPAMEEPKTAAKDEEKENGSSSSKANVEDQDQEKTHDHH